jgi:hypothetical protein
MFHRNLAGFCFTWGCCPMENAVCCPDKEHCCPENLPVCDVDEGRCLPKQVRGCGHSQSGCLGIPVLVCNIAMTMCSSEPAVAYHRSSASVPHLPALLVCDVVPQGSGIMASAPWAVKVPATRKAPAGWWSSRKNEQTQSIKVAAT